jgi:putative hemolysin
MIWLWLSLLLVCSGVISASETALFALSRRTLYTFAHSPHALQRLAARLMEAPRSVLLTVLMSNTAVNVAIFAVSYIALEHLGERLPGAEAVGGIGTLLVVVLCGEMVPKALALRSSSRISPWAAALIQLLYTVLAPLRLVLGALLIEPITRLLSPSTPLPSAVSVEELRLLVQQSAHSGVLSSRENDMLQAIVTLREAHVREVMTPRVDVHFARERDTPDKVREVLVQARRRLIPVCVDDLDDIVGLLDARDFYLNQQTPYVRLLRPVSFVPEQIRLLPLLQHFRRQNTECAIVVDEYGGTSGLVTINDVLVRIVGDLGEDDHDAAAPATEEVDENTYALAGNLSIREWAETFGIRQVPRGVDTVGGLILARLGRPAHRGDSIHMLNLRLTVQKVRGRRIERVLLEREGAGGGDDAGEDGANGSGNGDEPPNGVRAREGEPPWM